MSQEFKDLNQFPQLMTSKDIAKWLNRSLNWVHKHKDSFAYARADLPGRPVYLRNKLAKHLENNVRSLKTKKNQEFKTIRPLPERVDLCL